MEKGITLTNPPVGELVYLNLPNHPSSSTDKTPPSPPANVWKCKGSNMGHEGVEIIWEPATDNNWISYYEIFRNGVSAFSVVKGTYDFHPDWSIQDTIAVRTVDGDGNASELVEALESD